MFALAVVIVSFAVLAKHFHDKKYNQSAELTEEDLRVIEKSKKAANSVVKISKDFFLYQSTEITRKEINKLHASEEFKSHASTRGDNVAEWNWQARLKPDNRDFDES